VKVVDSGVVLNALLGDSAAGALLAEPLAAPHLLDSELLNALRRLAAADVISGRRARSVLDDFLGLAIRRYPVDGLHRRIWQLRHNVTPYHATYVALAELLDAPLCTTDGRLAGASGPRCRFELAN
jgi:predicted nucleic acid-binding protein